MESGPQEGGLVVAEPGMSIVKDDAGIAIHL